MLDGYWDEGMHRMIPSRSPFTVAIQRSIANCYRFIADFNELRFQCSYCLDRATTEDY